MDRGAWGAVVHGVAESDMTEHTQAVVVFVRDAFYPPPDAYLLSLSPV